MAKRKHKPVRIEYALDIIIPVYGQADLLSQCIAALPAAADSIARFDSQHNWLLGEDSPSVILYRLIIVDDCGPEQDQLGQVYRSLNGNSKVIHNRQNSGFAKTVNSGVSQGNAPFILLLNSDCILQPGAIPAMLKAFDDKDVGIVGPKLLFGDNRWNQGGKVQHAGLCRNLQGQLIHINLGWAADHPKVNERREMQMVTGACLMTRREVWGKVLAEYRKYGDPSSGALNEVYDRGGYEDVEYCLAARTQGYKVVYEPEAVGLHYVGASIMASGGQFPIGRNAMIFGARCGHLVEYDEWRYL
jgi:GT2 family glycosyltransferase